MEGGKENRRLGYIFMKISSRFFWLWSTPVLGMCLTSEHGTRGLDCCCS